MKALLIILSFFISTSCYSEESSKNKYLSILEDDIILGKESAPVTIIEYSSLSCPSCAYFHNTILPEIESKYVDSGKVKIIFRHYPMHPIDLKAASMSLCADKKDYYTFLKVFFKTQANWAFESSRPEETLSSIARLGGLDGEKIDLCLSNKAIENKILESRQIAQREFSINSTPTLIINGEILTGVPSKKQLFKKIDKLLS